MQVVRLISNTLKQENSCLDLQTLFHVADFWICWGYPEINLWIPLQIPHTQWLLQEVLLPSIRKERCSLHQKASITSYKTCVLAWNREWKKSNGGKKVESEILQQSYGHKVTNSLFFLRVLLGLLSPLHCRWLCFISKDVSACHFRVTTCRKW